MLDEGAKENARDSELFVWVLWEVAILIEEVVDHASEDLALL